jgi:glycine/D-amino acid oxidase-like deaminating enzyme
VRESVRFFDHFADETRLKHFDLGLRHQGYLFAASTEEGARRQERLVENQRAWGLTDVEVITGEEARRRFPYLGADIVNARFRPGDGWLNPRALAIGLARASRAEFLLEHEVLGFERRGERVVGLRTNQGLLDADQVVLAAGPLSSLLAKKLGLDLRISPVRRQKLIIPSAPVPRDATMTIEFETGAHWRPAHEGAFALWTSPAPAEPPLDDVPTSSDFAFGLLDPKSDHALARIVPLWKEVWESPNLTWCLQAGQYDYTPDHRPLIGPSGVPGLALNTGYSGHGIMGSIGGSRLLIDVLTGKVAPADNPFRPERPMSERAFDVL